MTFEGAVSAFGLAARAKLSNVAVTGEPEDQLRAPLEKFLRDLAHLIGFDPDAIVAVGESALGDLKTRPDYAVTRSGALVGFMEVKAPGKGSDPRRFRSHDKAQWEKLQSLPNLLYTDGNEFSLWRSGDLVGSTVRLEGDVGTAGSDLSAPPSLLGLIEDFIRWDPIPPRTAKQLAEISARMCRLLRDEVTEQLERNSPALTSIATDWRRLLFPDATDTQFADGYAQAVTFGLLMARARNVDLSDGLDHVARELAQTNSLIGSALRLLTDEAENQQTLKTSLGTLTRVLGAVHWPTISRGDPDAWLYFYENFLEVYDNKLRKQTGSYYTPPGVVSAMVGLVDDALRTRFALPRGLASEEVTLADPAVGTGTFLLGILRRIAEIVSADQGDGAVPAAVDAAIQRILAFEIQLGPFAVAQLRILAELAELAGRPPTEPLRMFVTDTLSNPYVEQEWIPAILAPIAESGRQANEIKKHEPITVVIGNPPYKEKAKGRGGWVESGSENSPEPAPLVAWMPPRIWGVGAHTKHLRNLYVYFWRWATWKVFDHHPEANTGIVCFITVAGFLNGPGFQKMRDYLRRTADEIWVIDCSPEGHQPDVSTRIFQGVQQPICIVLASRSPHFFPGVPARVRYLSLPNGHREEKLDALQDVRLDSGDWIPCSNDWRAPFLPAIGGDWATYPALADFFDYDGSGVMPGRTWVIAPDADSLRRRWDALVSAPDSEKGELFQPHLNRGQLGDRHIEKVVSGPLHGFPATELSVASEAGRALPPIRYGFRSFDRQWIIPDNRLINRPNPELWRVRSGVQVYLTAPADRSPSAGPAVTFTALIPDLHHYNGRGGRVFPLWRGTAEGLSNTASSMQEALGRAYSRVVPAEDLFAYIAGIAAHPAYVERFIDELTQPGLRIPVTADSALFVEVVEVGRKVIWLHTFGERFAEPASGRPPQAPRMTGAMIPTIPAAGAIHRAGGAMPDDISHDPATHRLLIGSGYVEGVSEDMWEYEVSGKKVLRQWFSYRKADRERPIMGDRRAPSRLGEIQPDRWLAEYTTELLNLLHVIGRLIELEPRQAELLERVCTGPTISAATLVPAENAEASTRRRPTRETRNAGQHDLLDGPGQAGDHG